MKQTSIYTPSQKILENYANVLVWFALGGGKGIKRGDVVRIVCPEAAKPLYRELRLAVTRAGGHIIGMYMPNDDERYNLSRDFYLNASAEQLAKYHEKYYTGIAETIDHNLVILADRDVKAMEGIDPKKLMQTGITMQSFRKLLQKKEAEGKYTWTLALYGTPEMAAEVKMSQQEYWKQIIHACFLDQAEPIKKWKEISKQIHIYQTKLNKLKIQSLHVAGADVDLTIKLGPERKWIGGSGRNIPSFEIFTSPDWRGTNGWIRFNQPLYRYGNLITGIELWFRDGLVIKSKATKNEKVLKQMIATENADKVGEFSLTDSRFSRITKFMGNTLYNENVGGKYGNTHIALGNAYHDCYIGDPATVTKQQWEAMGYNSSSVHTDIISTTDRTVTATLVNGKQVVIYKDGKYAI